MPACTQKVKVKTPAGAEAELVPKKVWMLEPKGGKGGKGVKIGLFQDPQSGKYFRAKVPQEYPECA
ncbi:MAG: chromatin protein Cren7 [Acidilobaceae archaeon]|nr:chromatin protein Cren7 [Acidilobaceae archaeon]